MAGERAGTGLAARGGVRCWAIGVIGWVSNACVPFAVPPGQASLGSATTGAASRRPPRSEGSSYTVRAAFHPLGVIEEYKTRTIDLGAGYALESVARPAGQLVAEGPYVELAAYPWQVQTGSWTTRAGVRTSADMLVADQGVHRAGYGGSVALALEFLSFAHGAIAAGGGGAGVAAAAHGEGGIGSYVGVSHRSFQDDSYWVASAGISLRVPATAGVFCCVKP